MSEYFRAQTKYMMNENNICVFFGNIACLIFKSNLFPLKYDLTSRYEKLCWFMKQPENLRHLSPKLTRIVLVKQAICAELRIIIM